MPTQPRNFFDHSLHKLKVYGVDALLDVLAFEGTEALSQPFNYQVEFTCADGDIGAETMLGKSASFSLFGSAQPLPIRGLNLPPITPLRVLNGVITGFKRLSGSADEARYEVTLEPHLALLRPGQQYRIYQHESVPQIVEGILRSRHDFEGQDFFFNLVREYPRREQVMQYGESDLAFISRLLADVGIWYRFTRDERLDIDVVEFHDDQRHYQFDVGLAYRPPSGLSSSGQDAVWGLQTSHQVVEQHVNIRSYHHRVANAFLNGDIDQTRGASGTWGEAYHYAEAYTELGDPYAYDEDLLSESGFFYARLRHERYLNGQTRLSGVSSSATLTPGQVLKISGGAPQAFAPGAVITRLTTRAARDRSVVVSFEAIPYSETVCFRPALQPKPQIAGTVPARVTSPQEHDPYGHIDMQGRYKVNFLFDRDSWKRGEESLWLRLARPYAGDTHGLHLPLIPGTEVAIAFEQGDPDRPYIAHALHDSEHPDHVTLARRDFTRNVLRTPANNKLRMEDQRGQEHVKLSTEYAGKSQLNLGHLVDAKKQKRGEGFELRTDGWGAIRGGKGVFISADGQVKAGGEQLDMSAAIGQLEEALHRVRVITRNAAAANALEADVAVPERLKAALSQLQEAGFLVSAPAGMALVTPEDLLLSAGQTLSAVSNNTDFSVLKRYTVSAGQAIGLFAQQQGLTFVANQGKVSMQAQNDSMELLARQGLDISSTEDEIRITAKKRITLNVGSNYITIDPYRIEIGSPGEVEIKAPHFDFIKTAGRLKTDLSSLADPLADEPNRLVLNFYNAAAQPMAGVPYILTFDNGKVLRGKLDERGYALHNQVPERPARVEYQLPDPEPDPSWPYYDLLAQQPPDAEEYLSQASGPGVWVTKDYDYLGIANLAIGLLNRATSMGNEGRVIGSDGSDFKNTMRDVIQEWKPLPEDAPPSLLEISRVYKYGEIRRKRQRYLEGADNWAISGSSWHWMPVIANKEFETEE